MRILALRTDGLVIPSVHASMAKAFKSLGIEVLDLPVPQGSEELQSFISLGRKDFQAIFTIDLGGNFYFISVLKDIQRTLRIPWIVWFVDDPEGYGFPLTCEPKWTIAFCWDKEITDQISFGPSEKEIPLIHLPLAADPDLFYPEEISSDLLFPGGVFVGSTAQPNDLLEEVARAAPGFSEDLEALWQVYKGDLKLSPQTLVWMHLHKKAGQAMSLIQADPLCRLWVQGAVYMLGIRKRQELVSRVIGPGGGIFGDKKWENIVGDHYQGQVAYGETLRKVYNQSAFVLDIRQPQARTGLTQRVFDASACGRPVLAEYSPELETLFEPEEELLWFDNPHIALEMGERCLKDPKEANKRAEKAKSRVLARHTYGHRAARVLEVLQERGK